MKAYQFTSGTTFRNRDRTNASSYTQYDVHLFLYNLSVKFPSYESINICAYEGGIFTVDVKSISKLGSYV